MQKNFRSKILKKKKNSQTTHKVTFLYNKANPTRETTQVHKIRNQNSNAALESHHHMTQPKQQQNNSFISKGNKQRVTSKETEP